MNAVMAPPKHPKQAKSQNNIMLNSIADGNSRREIIFSKVSAVSESIEGIVSKKYRICS